jgi:hypothetical protein
MNRNFPHAMLLAFRRRDQPPMIEPAALGPACGIFDLSHGAGARTTHCARPACYAVKASHPLQRLVVSIAPESLNLLGASAV